MRTAAAGDAGVNDGRWATYGRHLGSQRAASFVLLFVVDRRSMLQQLAHSTVVALALRLEDGMLHLGRRSDRVEMQLRGER